MINRMSITYRSAAVFDGVEKPHIFTTGGYTVSVGGRVLNFDFEDMQASVELRDGYLYIRSEQQNLDSTVYPEYTDEDVDRALRVVRKEDFTEIFYECFMDSGETQRVDLEVVDISFYDSQSGEIIDVLGDTFRCFEDDAV